VEDVLDGDAVLPMQAQLILEAGVEEVELV
jgi:hypothetical protein